VLDDDLRPIEPEDGIDYLLALARDLGRCSYLVATLVIEVDPAARDAALREWMRAADQHSKEVKEDTP
jgi:hypothetical protein